MYELITDENGEEKRIPERDAAIIMLSLKDGKMHNWARLEELANARRLGAKAHWSGKARGSCPKYSGDRERRAHWLYGFDFGAI